MNETQTLGPAAIAATAGVALSLVFNYVPGLSSRFDRLSADMQRVVMGAMLVLTAVGMALWQCSGTPTNDAMQALCGEGINWRALLTNVVFALIGNQASDRISPKQRMNETAATATELLDPSKVARDPSRFNG